MNRRNVRSKSEPHQAIVVAAQHLASTGSIQNALAFRHVSKDIGRIVGDFAWDRMTSMSAQKLLDAVFGMEALWTYINNQRTQKWLTRIASQLRAKGADLNRITSERWYGTEINNTPLMRSVLYSGGVAAPIALLEAGADIDKKNWAGRTALMEAVDHGHGHTEIARVLIERGANTDMQDRTGTTALMMAARDGYKDIVRLLLDAGAKKHPRDMYGRTALKFAVEAAQELDYMEPVFVDIILMLQKKKMVTKAATKRRR